MPYVEKSINIKCQPEKAYVFAKDMENYPNFMRDVQSVKVLSSTGDAQVSDWVTEIDGTEIIWTEEDSFDDDNQIISYKLTEGDLDKFEGQWRFTATPEGTQVVLTVDFDFGIPELVHLIGDILELKVAENTEMMLEGLKKALEPGA